MFVKGRMLIQKKKIVRLFNMFEFGLAAKQN